MGALSPWHLMIVLVVVLVLFGPSQLPKLGKSLGQTMRAVKDGMADDTRAAVDDDEA